MQTTMRVKNGKKRGNNKKYVLNGPIRTSTAVHGSATYRYPMYRATALTSSGVGLVQNEVPLFDVQLCDDFADLQTSWREFRVLAAEVKFFPSNRYSKSTTTCQPLLGVVAPNEVSFSLSSYTQAYAYDSCKMLSLEDPWVLEYRLPAKDFELGRYEPTSSVTGKLGQFKLFSSGLSLSSNYGQLFVSYVVEVRGRK
jgi:hypothetical protein